MRLYTGTGDDGETGLHDGSRVAKDDQRIEAYGTVDELNAALGMAGAACEAGVMRERLGRIQEDLFVVGSDLATPSGAARRQNVPTVTGEDVRRLEGWIDEAADAAGPLRNFVLPGGGELAARLHVARTICRRAERGMITLARHEDVSRDVRVYVNRLSDLLFAWARQANAQAGVPDVEWTPGRHNE